MTADDLKRLQENIQDARDYARIAHLQAAILCLADVLSELLAAQAAPSPTMLEAFADPTKPERPCGDLKHGTIGLPHCCTLPAGHAGEHHQILKAGGWISWKITPTPGNPQPKIRAHDLMPYRHN